MEVLAELSIRWRAAGLKSVYNQSDGWIRNRANLAVPEAHLAIVTTLSEEPDWRLERYRLDKSGNADLVYQAQRPPLRRGPSFIDLLSVGKPMNGETFFTEEGNILDLSKVFKPELVPLVREGSSIISWLKRQAILNLNGKKLLAEPFRYVGSP